MSRYKAIRGAALALCATTLAGGCQTTLSEPSEPSVRVVEKVVTKPLPCPALASLGPEPAYPDTPEAVVRAANVAERAKLYATGRAMRQARLMLYVAAATACNF